jgi:3',5'-cyclic AMP phosphodiesterase CpdA
MMPKFTLVQLSDTHLSASRPFFQFNYEMVVEAVTAIAPDHVVITGDLGLNGPEDIADVAFAAGQFNRLGAPWSAVPGNHDVGLVPFEGGLHQPVTEDRHAAYLGAMGSDRFVHDIGDWRLIGINSQLLGSGLPAEAEQLDWLSAALSETARPIALFLHYPLFLDDPADQTSSHAVVLPEARAALMALLDATPTLRLVASGHLHEVRRVERNGVVHQWGPATSFITTDGNHGGLATTGFLVHRFDGETFTTERISPRWMINHDIASWGNTEPHGYYEIVKRPYPHVT